MPPAKLLPTLLLLLVPVAARSQTLTLSDEVRTAATLTNTAVTLNGRAQLHITGNTGDPLSGSTVNLTTPDTWLFFDNILPAAAKSAQLAKIRIQGAAAVADTNVRLARYGAGTAVIPHAPAFPALTVYEGNISPARPERCFRGPLTTMTAWAPRNPPSAPSG